MPRGSRLAGNASRFAAKGVVREGEALLGVLVTCGHCGYRMMVVYNEKVHQCGYICRTKEPLLRFISQSVQAKVVDDLVAKQVLKAIQPAALELSPAAAEELDREPKRLGGHWQRRLERAAYQAKRAWRQYDAIGAENRLVTRELDNNGKKHSARNEI